MRSLQLLLGGLLAASSSLVRAEPQTASIYIQPIRISSPPPTLLAEITFDLSPSSSSDEDAGAASPPPSAAEAELGGSSGGAIKAAVTAFEAPELPDHTTSASSLVRIGVYDTAAGRWASSTSVASAESFGRGYAPHFVLTVLGGGKGKGEVVVGAACRGVRVDAGATRDFGPQAVVVLAGRGRQPALNKPVVLSAEGKQVPPVEEKTLLQKYVEPGRRPYYSLGGMMLTFFSHYLQVLVAGCAVGLPPGYGRRGRQIEYMTARYGYILVKKAFSLGVYGSNGIYLSTFSIDVWSIAIQRSAG